MDLNPRPLHKRLGTLPLRLAKELFVKPTFPILCQQFASSIVPSPEPLTRVRRGFLPP